MVETYQEVKRNILPKEVKEYAQGIGLMNDMAASLHARGLLPRRFSPTTPVSSTSPDSAIQQQAEMLRVFGCEAAQIAHGPDEIGPYTKAYVGSLVHPDGKGGIVPIFQRLAAVDHIYTSFPEGRIRRETLRTDGRLKSPDQALAELQQAGIKVDAEAGYMIRQVKFTGKPGSVELFWQTGYDVGLNGIVTINDRFARIEASGLAKCDAEVAIYQRLADQTQPLGSWYYMTMDTITVRYGGPGVFALERDADGLWLHGEVANLDDGWYPKAVLVACLRK